MTLTASVLSLQQRENNHGLDLKSFFLYPPKLVSVLPTLDDLLESSTMSEPLIRLPPLMLLAWRNDPLDCNQSEHKAGEVKRQIVTIYNTKSAEKRGEDGWERESYIHKFRG